MINKVDKSPQKVGNVSMEDFVNHFQKLGQKCSVLEDSTTSVKESFDPRVINHSLNEEINQKISVEEIMALVKKN